MEKIKYFLGFLSEENGQLSAMRVVFVVGSFFAMFMGGWVFYVTKNPGQAMLTVSTIAMQFGLQKIWQKYTETKPEQKPEEQK